jgi:outer membrane cobalamin receptor
MRDHPLRSFLSGLLLLLSLPRVLVFAQEDPDVIRLEEVEVTATPLIQGNRVSEFGSQVTSVLEEQIRNLNAQDLPSALRRVPGVVVSRHNPIGSFGGGDGGTVFIRGQGVSRPGAEISMLVDGIPSFVSVWTHPLMDVLNVDVIESMDIYKGAQPVLFGNMAFAAVNMHTKRMREEGFFTRFETACGSYRTFTGVAEHGGKVEEFDYYLLASYRRSDGHREDADGEIRSTFGRIGTEYSDHWGFDLTFSYSSNWANDPGSTDPDVLSQGEFATRDKFIVATFSNHYDLGSGTVKFYLDRGAIDWTDQDEIPGLDTLTDYKNYGVRARETFHPWDDGTLLAGIDVDYISGRVEFHDPEGEDPSCPTTIFRMVAPYVLASQQFELEEGVTLAPSAGVRYIGHSEFQNEWGPQAGLVLAFGETEIHGSYARGINYPGIYVKVQDDVFLPGENHWQDLEAETLDHWEAGIAHAFGRRIRADVVFFHDRGKERIEVSPPPPFPPLLTNIGNYTIQGLEGTVSWSPMKSLTMFVGATYMEADPSDLPYTPRWSASAGTNWRPVDDLEVNLDASYLDEHKVLSRSRVEDAANLASVDSYFLLNGKVTWTLTPPDAGTKSEVYVAVENITNGHYEMKPGYPMPGTSVMLGLSLEF